MKYRKLRIAFSSLCTVILVSLIALWVQSYYWHVFVSKRLTTSTVTLQANHGELGIWSMSPLVPPSLSPDADWDFGRRPLAESDIAQIARDDSSTLEFFGFRYVDLPPVGSVFFVPFWAVLLPVAAAAPFPWIKWRIGWRSAISAVCLLTTVLLIGLWVRSYKWIDITDRTSPINVCSMKGQLFFGEALMVFGTDTLTSHPPIPDSHLGICSLPQDEFDLAPLHGGIAVPYWLVVVLSIPIAAVPWLRLRFSLRTMLVATALAAVVLTLASFAVNR